MWELRLYLENWSHHIFPRAVALSPPVLSNTVSHDYILRVSYVSLDLSKPIWSNGAAKMSARTESGHHEVAHNEECLASFTGGDKAKEGKNPAGGWQGCQEREKMCKRKTFATKCRERLWTWSPRRGVLTVAIWRRAGFCISRSSLYASQHTLLYLGKWMKIDLQHPDTLVQMWKCLSMLSKTSSHAYKKCGSAYSWAVSCSAVQDHLIVSCPSIPLLVLVLLILYIFWQWGHSFSNMFAECRALRGFQRVTAKVILCFVNLGQPAVFPGTIWWAQRMSGSNSAKSVSFYSSRTLQAPAWYFYTIWKFVCWSCAYTSKEMTLGTSLAPEPVACWERLLVCFIFPALLGYCLESFSWHGVKVCKGRFHRLYRVGDCVSFKLLAWAQPWVRVKSLICKMVWVERHGSFLPTIFIHVPIESLIMLAH